LAWTVEYTDTALKEIRKLDKQNVRRIVDFMEERVAGREDPRSAGKILTGMKGGLWRYRVGDYRIICDIQDGRLRVLVLQIGHRREVYR